MAISTDDRNRYRGGLHATGAILNRVPKIVLATMQINQSAFTYPIAQLTVDNIESFGTFKPGHLVLIGTTPGAWDVTTGVISKPPTESTLYIDAKSQGDPGWRRSIITPLADNQYITILKFRPAQGLLSSIRNGVFYKRWDIPYTGQGSNPDPVPVMGEWLQAWAIDGVATVSLNASASWAWGNRGIASNLWNLDGGSVNAGALDDAALTADFEPGFYELEHTVTDGVGKSRTGYRYLWVNDRDPLSEFAPFSWRNPCSITDDKQEVNGREIGISFNGNLGVFDELFPGQGFLLSETPKFRGESLDGDSFVGCFVGYATDGNKTTSFKKRKTDLTITSPLRMADFIPTATQEINEAENPSSWAEVGRVLSNPVGAVWYVAAHHSPYLIDGHDFTYAPELLLLRRQTFQFRSTNIGGQIKTIAEMMKGLIGQKSNGRLRMVRSPMSMSLTDRNALPTLWEWLPRDIVGTFNRAFMLRMETSQVNGYAFAFDGSQSIPYQSLAPGFVRAQADGVDSITPFIVRTDEGQQRVNDVAGHEFAEKNGLPRFNIVANRNLDFCEPCDADLWHTFNVPAKYDSEGYGWINERAIVTRVTRTWNYDSNVTKSIQIEFQPESYGVPGVTIPVDRGGANNWWETDWNPGLFDYYQDNMPDLGLDLPVMLAINSDGLLGRTFTFTERQVSWERLTVPAGQVVSFSLRWDSPYFSDPEQALGFYILTNDNGSLHVYTLVNALSPVPAYEEFINSPLTAGSGFAGKAKIKSSRTVDGFILIAWRNQTGVLYSRSTVANPALSAPAHAGSAVTDIDHTIDPLGMDLNGDYQALTAPNGSTDLNGVQSYSLFVATGEGAFSEVSGNPLTDSTAYLGAVTVSEPDRVYVGFTIPEPPTPPPALGVVTFDAGGQTGYSLISGSIIAGVGRPDNCVYSPNNVNGAAGNVGVSINCTFPDSKYVITDIEYDLKGEHIGGSIFGKVESFSVRAYAGGRLVGSGSATLRESYGDGWLRYGIRSDELELIETPDSIIVGYGYSITGSTAGAIIYAYVDNIVIIGDPITFESTRSLFKVIPSVSDWSDITPRGGQIPLNTYALTFEPGANSNLSSIGTAENGKTYLLSSSSEGANWTIISRTTYAGLARGGDTLLAWGYNAIGLSPDAGATFYPRIGDWVASVGAVGEIIQVGGVL